MTAQHPSTIIHPPQQRDQWWRDAVIYQIYPRSYASSGGPLGTLPGITEKFDYLEKLGVDAVWLSPFYVSPQFDAGYDVADYRDVDPRFGTLADAERLIEAAHAHGMKVIVDIVPNHTSWDHKLFREAVLAGAGAPQRDNFWFRPGRGEDGSEPPTDWLSSFGGPAWSQVKDIPWVKGTPQEREETWYLHLFDRSQPDVNWESPAIHDEFAHTIRFWMDRGVDGLRVDVAHGLAKDPDLPDWPYKVEEVRYNPDVSVPPAPMANQPAVHDIYREWRSILDEYGRDRMMVAEAWVDTEEDLARYVRSDEMQQAFNFEYLSAPWRADRINALIESSLRATDAVGAPTTWVLSNHDTLRATSRLGLEGVTTGWCGNGPSGIGPDDPQPDAALGARRARAWHTLTAALPGSYYLYQGEELELPEATQLPPESREDPTFARTGGAELGRDGCRVPIPWRADAPAFGFSPDGESWLPQPADWGCFAVDTQEADPESALAYYTELLHLRARYDLGLGGLRRAPEYAGSGVALINNAGDSGKGGSGKGGSGKGDAAATSRGDLLIMTAFAEPLPLPEGWAVLLSSAPLEEEGVLPPDTTVYLVPFRTDTEE